LADRSRFVFSFERISTVETRLTLVAASIISFLPCGQSHEECFFFLYIFSRFLYIFYNTIFIPAVIQGWADLIEWQLLLLGCTRERGDWVRIEPRTGINSHRVRIEPGTGHQQSSVLTTELRCTPTKNFGRMHVFVQNLHDHVGLQVQRGHSRTFFGHPPGTAVIGDLLLLTLVMNSVGVIVRILKKICSLLAGNKTC
jgi:hypothetical protein